MSDRFYLQQLNKLGVCPGRNGRKKRMAWTDELRQEAIEAYEAANPTAENSMEIVAEIAENMQQSVNGVRQILSKAKVYITKTPASVTKGKPAATARVSKEASQQALIAAIEALGKEADEDIISKLTGKAAVYFTGILASE